MCLHLFCGGNVRRAGEVMVTYSADVGPGQGVEADGEGVVPEGDRAPPPAMFQRHDALDQGAGGELHETSYHLLGAFDIG